MFTGSLWRRVPASAAAASDRRERGILYLLMLVLAFAGLALSGCASTRGGPVPYDVQDFGTPDTPEPTRLEDYRIEPLDGLRINVFQVPDLSGEFEVDLNGEIAFPLIGTVKVAERTTRELQTDLKQRLRKFVKEPVVSIAVKPTAKRSITVDGSVRNPGMYPVSGSMSLLQAIALANGLDERANPRRIAVFRRIGGKRMAAAFDLQSIRRGQAEDPEVHSGDIIVVDGSKTKDIQREILQSLPILGLFRPF